jgi:hypothetical protein
MRVVVLGAGLPKLLVALVAAGQVAALVRLEPQRLPILEAVVVVAVIPLEVWRVAQAVQVS